MKAIFLAAGLALAASPASAALPDAAYQGDLWSRLWSPTKCVSSYANLPDFIRKDDAAGVYVWFNPATGQCEKGGAASGPQF
jgi:hypothetical protein